MKRFLPLVLGGLMLSASLLSAVPAPAASRTSAAPIASARTSAGRAPLKLLKPAEPLPVDSCAFYLTQHVLADPEAVRQLLPKAKISYEPDRKNWKRAIVRYDTQTVTLTRQRGQAQLADEKKYYLTLLPKLDNDRNLAVTRDLGRKAGLLKQVVSVSSTDPDDPDWPKLVSGLAQLWHGTLLYRDEVLDPRLRVLLARRDDWEDHSVVPWFPSALERRARSENLLLRRKLPIFRNLAPVVAEEELVHQPARQVMERALTLLVLASSTTTLTRQEAADMLTSHGLLHELTLAERSYLTAEELGEAEVAAMNLRFEAAYALLWSLGVVDKATFPGQASDLAGLIARVKRRPFKVWFAQAKLRPASQILDQLDLSYRLSWAKKEHGDRYYKPLLDLQASLIHQWHHSLLWLTAQKGWEQVKTEY